jgi:hypothetical protein
MSAMTLIMVDWRRLTISFYDTLLMMVDVTMLRLPRVVAALVVVRAWRERRSRCQPSTLSSMLLIAGTFGWRSPET